MKLDLQAMITIGYAFKIENRGLQLMWSGKLDDVCDQIMGSGHSVGQIFSDKNSQVAAHPVRMAVRDMFLGDASKHIQELLPLIKNAISGESAGDGSAIEDLIKTLPREKTVMLYWYCGIAGASRPVDAIVQAHPELLNVLLPNKMPLLAWACIMGQQDIMELLESHGANLLFVNDYCWSCTDLANANGHKNILQRLVEKGCPPVGQTLSDRMRARGIAL